MRICFSGKGSEVQGSAFSVQRLKDYIVKRPTCYSCPLHCKRSVRIEKPWKSDPIYGAPQYETLVALGCNCGVDNLEALIKANELCNRFGMDTISTGVSISFAMELFEKGILNITDTEGLELKFGNEVAMLELTERIGKREGNLGRLLGEGTKIAAEKIPSGMRVALVVSSGQKTETDLRFAETVARNRGINLLIFTSMDDALAWLQG